MQITDNTVYELIKKLKTKEISAQEVTNAYTSKIEENNREINSFITTDIENAKKYSKIIDKKLNSGEKLGLLSGIPVGIKDNTAVKGMKLTCGSQLLSNFVANYDATVVGKLKSQGVIVLGKNNTDEFSMGSSTKTSFYGPTRNPLDTNRVPGGSSGGSAASVASSQVPFSLGSSTGGSVRHPASYCGIVGFKPTYGLVSRHGLVTYSSSLDHIGTLTKDVTDAGLILSLIKGIDEKDPTSLLSSDIKYIGEIKNTKVEDIKNFKIGIPKEYFGIDIDIKIKAKILKRIEELENLGAKVEEISLGYTKYSSQVYKIVADSEAFSNLSKFNGIENDINIEKYENIDELIKLSRGRGFGREVKRRILLGTYFLNSSNGYNYYEKAQIVRKLISEEIYNSFKDIDIILAPTTKSIAPKIDDNNNSDTKQTGDILTIPANLAGIPAITVPCGKVDNMPIGIQIMGDRFREDTVLKVARICEIIQNEQEKDSLN